MKTGRPSEYDPKHCDTVVQVMSMGKSLAAAAVKIGVNRQTLYNWAQEHPEMAQAISDGQEASMVYWEDLAEKAINGEIPGNASIFNFQMKNRFRKDYQDSSAMTVSGGEDPLKLEQELTIKFIEPDNTAGSPHDT